MVPPSGPTTRRGGGWGAVQAPHRSCARCTTHAKAKSHGPILLNRGSLDRRQAEGGVNAPIQTLWAGTPKTEIPVHAYTAPWTGAAHCGTGWG